MKKFKIKSILMLFVCILCAQYAIADDQQTFNAADWQWANVGNGGAQSGKATFTDLFGGPQVISIVKYAEGNLNTSLVYNEGTAKATTTSGAASANLATVAINGSYFDNTSTSATYLYTTVPMWYKDQMITTSKEASRSTGVIGFKADGTIGFESFNPDLYADLQQKYASFIASGPLLVLGGQNQTIPSVNASFDGVNPRSMIGVTADRTVYMVVVDGRKTNATGVTVTDMQQLANWLGLTDAINLDGGGSSALWALGKGVINTPSDASERTVPSVIIAKDKSGTSLSAPDLVDGYYEISTASNLFWFADQVNQGYSTINAKLVADINLANAEWTPIGLGTVSGETYTATKPFAGNFDGQGHTISGLNVAHPQLAGFIGFYTGTGFIKDFTIEGNSVCTNTTTSNQCLAAGVVAFANKVCTIQDIWSKVNVSVVAGSQRAAGVIGRANAAVTINRCRFSGTASATDFVAGGIIAYPAGTAVKVTNCLFDGTIAKTTSGYAGGIIGYNNKTLTLSNCLAFGEGIDFTGSANVGALVSRTTATITATNNCYTGTKALGSGTALTTAAVLVTTEELANGTVLANVAQMDKDVTGFYPIKNSQSNWTQDFAAGQAYPVPTTSGFECTHTQDECTFCGNATHTHNYTNGFCSLSTCEEPFEAAALNAGGYYEIASGGNLFWFAQQVNAGNANYNAKLTADVDLENREWTPMGLGTILKEVHTPTTPFAGNFDGQGHKITGLNVTHPQMAGFIGFYSGTGKINNFTIEGTSTCTNTTTTDQCMAAGVIAFASKACVVEDIWSKVDVSVANVTAQRAAGIVGRIAGALTINRCRYSGTASAPSFVAGGIIAFPPVSGTKITNCLFDGHIAKTSSYSGGIVGYNNNSGVTISNCLALGEGIDFTSGTVGAIISKTPSISATGNYYTGTKGVASGTLSTAPVLATAQQLANGTVLAGLASMTKGTGNYYPAESATSNWSQDFSAGDAMPLPKVGFTCTHIRASETDACSFCGDGDTGGGGGGETPLSAGDKFENGGIYYIVNADMTSVTVTYPGASAPTGAGDNSYAGEITIPATIKVGDQTFNVTHVGDYAFQYSNITAINLPEGLTHVGRKAIYDTQITSITVPNSVTNTDYESFGYNKKLATVRMGENIAANTWGDKLFYTPSGQKKEVYMYCKAVPKLQTYTFSFTNATIHVYSMMVTAFKAASGWSDLEIIGDLLIDYTYADLEAAISQYSASVPAEAEIGTLPGCYTPSSAQAITAAVASAQALNSDATLKQINDAINGILAAYENLEIVPLNEGIYYITNVYKPATALYGDAGAAETQGLKIANTDSSDDKYYFQLVKSGANWVMKCMGSDMYVGTTVGGTGTGKNISLTSTPAYQQIITWVKGGQFTIKPTYEDGSAAPTIRSYSNIITTYNYASTDANATRTYWTFHPADANRYEQSYNLENSRVRAYMAEVTYATADGSKISKYNVAPPARRDQPVPVTVYWNTNLAATSQTLTLSESADFASPTVVALGSDAASYEIYNLIPGRKYYYKVEDNAGTALVSSSFTTTGQVRMLKADNVANIRDLGGWPTASGKIIQYGRIYRGAAFNPATMTEEEKQALLAVGIKAELDLRSENGEITSSVIGSSVEYKRIPLGQTSTYYDGLTTYKEQYKKDLEYVFSCVENDKPVYFHCAIGADRTGTLAFLLEGVLGVSESDLYKDYELTTLSGQTRTKSYMDKDVINYINSMSGTTLEEKFYTYFTDVLGIPAANIASFRQKMLAAEDAEFTLEGTTLKASGTITVQSFAEAVAANPDALNIDLTEADFAAGVSAENLLANGNAIIYVSSESGMTGKNIVNDGVCENLVLTDKYNFAPAIDFTATSATYSRSIDGVVGWNSVVLPYAITVPAGMQVLGNALVNGATIIFDAIGEGMTIEANTPFVYKNSQENVSFSAANVPIVAAPLANGELKGTYSLIPAGEATDKIILTADGSAFAKASSSASIPAFRAYIDGLVAGSNEFAIIINDDPTGLLNANAESSQFVDVYTTDGRLVRANASATTALQGLANGIYVVNGGLIKK